MLQKIILQISTTKTTLGNLITDYKEKKEERNNKKDSKHFWKPL